MKIAFIKFLLFSFKLSFRRSISLYFTRNRSVILEVRAKNGNLESHTNYLELEIKYANTFCIRIEDMLFPTVENEGLLNLKLPLDLIDNKGVLEIKGVGLFNAVKENIVVPKTNRLRLKSVIFNNNNEIRQKVKTPQISLNKTLNFKRNQNMSILMTKPLKIIQKEIKLKNTLSELEFSLNKANILKYE